MQTTTLMINFYKTSGNADVKQEQHVADVTHQQEGGNLSTMPACPNSLKAMITAYCVIYPPTIVIFFLTL